MAGGRQQKGKKGSGFGSALLGLAPADLTPHTYQILFLITSTLSLL